MLRTLRPKVPYTQPLSACFFTHKPVVPILGAGKSDHLLFPSSLALGKSLILSSLLLLPLKWESCLHHRIAMGINKHMGPSGNDHIFPLSHHKNLERLRSVWESPISSSLSSPLPFIVILSSALLMDSGPVSWALCPLTAY